jgi:hypothetical protein
MKVAVVAESRSDEGGGRIRKQRRSVQDEEQKRTEEHMMKNEKCKEVRKRGEP